MLTVAPQNLRPAAPIDATTVSPPPLLGEDSPVLEGNPVLERGTMVLERRGTPMLEGRRTPLLMAPHPTIAISSSAGVQEAILATETIIFLAMENWVATILQSYATFMAMKSTRGGKDVKGGEFPQTR